MVKEDFKVGEEGGERGGGLILGDIRYIYVSSTSTSIWK